MITDYHKFINYLKQTGRMKLLPQVLRELRTEAARKSALTPTLEVAHEKDEAHAKKVLKEQGITPERIKVNHALISGWRLKGGGTLIDQSAKEALIELYQRTTHLS